MTFRFTAFGVPQPKGSTKAFLPKGARFPVVTSDNPKVKGWQQLVAEAAGRALAGSGLFIAGPVRLEVTFYLRRPKALGRKTRPHLTKPDVSKLARSTEDALTGVVWRDDVQVIDLRVRKQYAGVGESPRADITITDLALSGGLYAEGDTSEQAESRANSHAETPLS